MGRKSKKDIVQEEFKLELPMTEENTVILSPENQLESIQQEIDQARIELENTRLQIEETKKQLQMSPNREISQQEKDIIAKQVTMTNNQTSLKSKIDAQKAHDSELVTGRFMNRRAPGQPVKLPYIKYDTDPVKWYPLEDGKVYTIPRGFADQLNGGTDEDPCYYTPQFIQKQGEMDPNKPESAIHAVDSSNKKYAFTPINF